VATSFVSAPAVTGSGTGTTVTASFTPPGLGTTGYVSIFGVVTTNNVAVTNVTTSAGAGMSYLGLLTSPVYHWVAGAAYVQYVACTFKSTSAQTLTFTFAGSVGTGPEFDCVNYVTNFAHPNWSVITTNSFNVGTTSPVLTAASGITLPGTGAFCCVDFFASGSGTPNASSNPQSWITYDTTNFVIHGDVTSPFAGTVLPATGFAFSGSPGNWVMLPMLLSPGTPASPLWVPPGADLNVA
jgi:hypothetical protein